MAGAHVRLLRLLALDGTWGRDLLAVMKGYGVRLEHRGEDEVLALIGFGPTGYICGLTGV